jgi:hypothetical protein
VKCYRAKEFLALDVGGDLPGAMSGTVTDSIEGEIRVHLEQCADCRRVSERLTRNQSLLRSLRHETVPEAALAEMRQDLFSRLNGAEARLGWWIRFERFLLLELRRPRYALAGAALMAIISGTLFTEMRRVTANANNTAAVFESRDTLRFPGEYRDWVLVGTSAQLSHSASEVVWGAGVEVSQNVYINPAAYREYKRTGVFPEGTVMVLESAKEARALTASVKDRRFREGWGFFRLSDEAGQVTAKAQALPEGIGCLGCHRDSAATDHVFTQFYPVLRQGSGVL